jgi:preprotein translocase subunit SecD
LQGIYWIRIGAIGALLFGSIYVLLPSFLQEDIESRLAARTADVDTTQTVEEVDMDVDFTVAGGPAAAASEVLQVRLEAAGLGFDRVLVETGIKVVLQPGASPADVLRLASREGAVGVYPMTALPELAAGDTPDAPTEWVALLSAADLDGDTLAPRLVAAAGQVPLGDKIAMQLSDVQLVDELTGVLSGSLEEAGRLVLLTVDGSIAAVALPGAARAQIALIPGYSDVDVVPILLGGPLGATLTETVVDASAALTIEAAPKEIVESNVPDWFLSLLPDTMINLGLDLQGGVDLTLQIGLDESVQSNVNRDAVRLKESARALGHDVASIRGDRSAPIIWIEMKMELGELQDFVQKNLGIDYVYDSTDGNRHGFAMAEVRQEQVKEQAIEQVLETLRKRVDATGVKEPSIVRKGGGRINVQLPGEVDLQSAIDAIGTTAVLQFRMVDEDFDDSVLDQILDAAEKAMPPVQYASDRLVNEWLWNTKRLTEDRLVLFQYEELIEGERERLYPLVLFNEVVLTGNDVNGAGVAFDQNQQPMVSLDFKPRGGQIFCEVTGQAVGKRFGIILDGELKSAPTIREQICGGSASIEMGSGMDPLKDAQTLGLVLRTGSLDAPVDLGGVSTVGASLGADSIRQGGTAAVVGGFIIVLFMGVWYRRSGMIANVALALNIVMVLAALATFGATLTLPGIAGIALTVGMAVDANIIIFERIREELRLGVHPRKAVDVGFDKGLVAVLDANVTTAIAGVVLYSYGTGPIKGFAVTLLVGIITTLITALFVTRTLMDIATRSSTARLRI